jgi:hypothetical protein
MMMDNLRFKNIWINEEDITNIIIKMYKNYKIIIEYI